MTQDEIKQIIQETVAETLERLGIDIANPMQMQQDFQHLREWRQTTQSVKDNGLKAIATMLVTGILAGLWVFVKDHLK